MTAGDVIKSYKDLDVWTMSMALAESCCRVTKEFPRDAMYGLPSQMRRASASFSANIACRDLTGSFIQFLRIAQGSARELETHLILAGRVGLAAQRVLCRVCWTITQRISKMLRSLIRSLEART